jgi:hypothetical protein
MEGGMMAKLTISSVRRCVKCGEPSHVRVMIPSNDKPHYDEFLFECRPCGHAETLYAKRD